MHQITDDQWDQARQIGKYVFAIGEGGVELIAFTRESLADYLMAINSPSVNPSLNDAKKAAAIAYGWLWHVTTTDKRINNARCELLRILDHNWQMHGIRTAKSEGAVVG